MRKSMLTISLAAIMFLTMACGMLGNLVGGDATAVTALWQDVPKLEGATRLDTEMPAAIKVVMNAALGGKFDFVVYKSSATPEQIKAFYSVERMQGLGWAADSTGCNNVAAQADGGADLAGGLCTFSKIENGKQSVLLIVLGKTESGAETRLFYARAILPPTPKP